MKSKHKGFGGGKERVSDQAHGLNNGRGVLHALGEVICDFWESVRRTRTGPEKEGRKAKVVGYPYVETE